MGTTTSFFLFLLSLSSLFTTTEATYGCKDMNGKDVDWYVVLKSPVVPHNNQSIFHNGTAYAYADALTDLYWTGFGLDEDKGAIYETLQQIYNIKEEVNDYAWFYYNDENFGGKYDSYGHCKGVASFNSNTGFWLIHSVPGWPNGSSYPNQFPKSGTKNGQSFLCMTYSFWTFNEIGYNWMIDKPHIYDFNFPEPFYGLSNIKSVIERNFITTRKAARDVELISHGGKPFLSFAKNACWNNDLYEFLVAPTLQRDLYVESWMNGRNRMPSYCRKNGGNYTYDVMNVMDVDLKGIEWTETKDHSKWAVTSDTEVPGYVCIGDINRQASQKGRAGGTCCFVEPALWRSMIFMIQFSEPCP